MKVWVNRLSTEILFDHGTSCNIRVAADPDVPVCVETDSANFVERWIKTNKAVEALFDGQPWPKHPQRYVTMVDFGKSIEFSIAQCQPDKIPTFLAPTRAGYMYIVQFYVAKNKIGRYVCHVRVREERSGVPSFLILDH